MGKGDRRLGTQLASILGRIVARLIGLNALMAALLFGFIAEGTISWSGLRGVIRFEWSTFATFISSICAFLTLVFLIPDFANWFLRKRGLLPTLLFAPFQIIAAGFVVWSFAVLATTKFGGAEQIWGTYILSVTAIFAILFVFPGSAAHVPDIPEPEDDFYVRSEPEQALAYRVVETDLEDTPAQRLEERRRRLMQRADHASLPPHIRRRLNGPRPARLWLAFGLTLPLLIIGALALYAQLFAAFLPAAEVTAFAHKHAVTFGLYGAAAGLTIAAFGDLEISRYWPLRRRALNLLVLPVGLAALAQVWFYPAVAVGLPDAMARQSGGPVATARINVVARADAQARLKCDFSIFVRVAENAQDHKLCHLEETTWRTLSPGMDLYLSGIATSYGLRYHQIRP